MSEPLLAMDMWYRQMPGSLLLQMEAKAIADLLSHWPGEFLVQMGGPSDLSLVEASRIPNQFHLANYRGRGGADQRILSHLHELPLLPNSVDVFVVAHAMGFVQQPKLMLKEIYDALVPGGHLLILGFNARSVWSFVRWKKKYQGFPWRGNFQGSSRVRRWLQQMGYSIMLQKTLCFLPPLVQRCDPRWIRFSEAVGQVLLPGFGAAYFLVAQKQSANMTALRTPTWEKKVVSQTGYAEPSMRVKND